MNQLLLCFLRLIKTAKQADLNRAGTNHVRPLRHNTFDDLQRASIVLSTRQNAGQRHIGGCMQGVWPPNRLEFFARLPILPNRSIGDAQIVVNFGIIGRACLRGFQCRNPFLETIFRKRESTGRAVHVNIVGETLQGLLVILTHKSDAALQFVIFGKLQELAGRLAGFH